MNASKIQLRVRSKRLRVTLGPRSLVTHDGHAMRYLIGRGRSAYVRCDHPEIGDEHCWIVADTAGVRVREADGGLPVYVNGERVCGECLLLHRDVLRIGPLELEVRLHSGQECLDSAGKVEGGEDISEWLMSADERERELRRHAPELRELRLAGEPPRIEGQGTGQQDREPEGSGSRNTARKDGPTSKKPPRRKPGKLPPPPPPVAAPSTEDAAQDALQHLFRSRSNDSRSANSS